MYSGPAKFLDPSSKKITPAQQAGADALPRLNLTVIASLASCTGEQEVSNL